ncbi:hypothetical protein [Wolbachia endosymbiont (group A) of Anomoia purmunda]|nr:hypothetical protein [Wolbachia endosymbiont (group A) of Anomoia purmunda]
MSRHWNDTLLMEIALKSQCSYSCISSTGMTPPANCNVRTVVRHALE